MAGGISHGLDVPGAAQKQTRYLRGVAGRLQRCLEENLSVVADGGRVRERSIRAGRISDGRQCAAVSDEDAFTPFLQNPMKVALPVSVDARFCVKNRERLRRVGDADKGSAVSHEDRLAQPVR